MSSFTITAPETEVVLRPTGVRRDEFASGTATYVVTNRSGQTVRTGLNFQAVTRTATGAEIEDRDIDVKWLSVRGEPDRDIGPGMSETFTVEVRFPGSSARYVTSEEQRKEHAFRAIAVNRKHGDNDCEVGSAIKFFEPVLVKSEVNWRIWAIAAAALVLVVGGTTWALWPRPKVELVSVVGQLLGDATKTLGDLELKVDDELSGNEVPNAGQEQHYLMRVVEQTPGVPEGEKMEIREGATVKLRWKFELKQVEVPELNLVNLEEASKRLRERGLQIGVVTPPLSANPPNRFHEALVVGWEPRGAAPALTAVTLFLDWRPVNLIVIPGSPRDFRVMAQLIPEPVKPELRRLEAGERFDRRDRERALEVGRGQ